MTETRGGRRVRSEYDPSKFMSKLHPDLRKALDERRDRLLNSMMFASIRSEEEDEVDDDDINDFDYIGEVDGGGSGELIGEDEPDDNDED